MTITQKSCKVHDILQLFKEYVIIMVIYMHAGQKFSCKLRAQAGELLFCKIWVSGARMRR